MYLNIFSVNSNTYLMCSFLQLYYTFTLLLRRMQIMKVDGGQQLSSSKSIIKHWKRAHMAHAL